MSAITREELYAAVWSKPLNRLTVELNTTYPEIVKACDIMNVPRPPNGHWQWIARDLVIDKEPLPRPDAKTPAFVVLLPPGSKPRPKRPKEVPASATPSETGTARDRLESTQLNSDTKGSNDSSAEGRLNKAARLSPHSVDAAQAALNGVLDMLRQAPGISFWERSISLSIRPGGLRTWLLGPEHTELPTSKLLSALKDVRKDFHTFQVTVVKESDRYDPDDYSLKVTIQSTDGFEWKDAWTEAWSLSNRPNPFGLSDNGLRLYAWAKGPSNPGTKLELRQIGARAALKGTYNHLLDHLREIKIKADPKICWEQEQGWRGKLRVWFAKDAGNFYDYGPLNPALGLDVSQACHRELEKFKESLYSEILKPGFPNGCERVGVFDLQSRQILQRVLNTLAKECGRFGGAEQFFGSVKLVDGIRLTYDFGNHARWLLVAQPVTGGNWGMVKESLLARAKEIPLEKRYGLSSPSGSLLAWILNLRKGEYQLGMTPPIEDHLETGMTLGLGSKEEENLAAYVDLMLEEINENTEFNLRRIPWKRYSHTQTRILVKRKPAGLDSVVRSIQHLGLEKSMVLDFDKVRKVVQNLLNADGS